jgi:prepilin signal peptidase PulO-like enzyme (type II secretory pathway)
LIVIGKRPARLPYGPYIAAAAALWIFAGHEMLAWYMSFMTSIAGGHQP